LPTKPTGRCRDERRRERVLRVDECRDLGGGGLDERGNETVARLVVCRGDVREALAGRELGPQRGLGDADVRRGGGEEAGATDLAVVLDGEGDIARERRHHGGADVGRTERRGRDPAGEDERGTRTDECLVEMLHGLCCLSAPDRWVRVA